MMNRVKEKIDSCQRQTKIVNGGQIAESDADVFLRMYGYGNKSAILTKVGDVHADDAPTTREAIEAVGQRTVEAWLQTYVTKLAAFRGMGDKMSDEQAYEIAHKMLTHRTYFTIYEWVDMFDKMMEGQLGSFYPTDGMTYLACVERYNDKERSIALSRKDAMRADRGRNGSSINGMEELRRYVVDVHRYGRQVYGWNDNHEWVPQVDAAGNPVMTYEVNPMLLDIVHSNGLNSDAL